MDDYLIIFHDFNKKIKQLLLLIFLNIGIILLTFIISRTNSGITTAIVAALLFLLIAGMILSVIIIRKIQETLKSTQEMHLKQISKTTLNKNRQFQKLMTDNLFEYHYQPIINAKSGDIFAYEAFMRTAPDIGLQPLEILDLATKCGCLHELEKYTLYNNLNFLKKNIDPLHGKKLFINSIINGRLSEEDFHELYLTYKNEFHDLVFEIMDTNHLNADNIKLLDEQMQKSGFQLSLDNYNPEHSTSAAILNTSPHYIKLDVSFLRYTLSSFKKQHIISNLIHFAGQNNMKVIAEGIETLEELEYSINLGVDYIQGFYLANPCSDIVKKLPKKIITQITEINDNRNKSLIIDKKYETKGETVCSTVAMALKMYSDIVIQEKEICLIGTQEMVANLSIIIPDGHNCILTLDNINLRGKEKPSILLGSDCSVTLCLIGDNYISYDGIRVPETSNLKLTGDGNLFITTERGNYTGIGGTSQQSYGNITLAHNGILKIKTNGSQAVSIGGGQNSSNSLIHCISGTTCIEGSGYNSVGIGNLSGNAYITLEGGSLQLLSEGTKAVAIGSLRGFVNINISAHLSVKCNGKNAVAIGAIDNSDGNIVISGGSLNIKFNTFTGSGIGALGGKVNILILKGDIEIYGNGSDVIGIGEHSGFGDILIKNGTISVNIYATNASPIGNIHRNIIIDGGNIQCDFPENITPVNSYGTPLVSRIIMNTNEFCQTVDTVSYSYEYHADFCERYPYIKVYLPENIIY